MSTFDSDIWTPGLERTSLRPKGKGQGGAVDDKAGLESLESKGGVDGGGSGGGGGDSDDDAHVLPAARSPPSLALNTGSTHSALSTLSSLGAKDVFAPLRRKGSSHNIHSSGSTKEKDAKDSMLYRIFHFADHSDDNNNNNNNSSGGFFGRSKRMYSGSESEFDTSDTDHSLHSDHEDTTSVTNSNSMPRMTFANSASTATLKSSVPRITTSTSGAATAKKNLFGRRKTAAVDSESESETEVSRSTRPQRSIFKGLLSSSAPSVPHSQSSSDATAAHNTSDSESDADHHHHSTGNIFKNIMMGGKKKAAPAPVRPPVPNPSSTVHSSTSTPHLSTKPPAPTTPPITNVSVSAATLSSSTSLSHSTASLASLALPPVVSTSQTSNATIMDRSGSDSSMNSEKYGANNHKSEKILGRGATAVVKLCSPINSDKKFAVKEFRLRRKDERQKEYVKKLIAEFCISSTLDHENIIKTVDLIQDDKKRWCVVMEYAEGGDLYSKISGGLLTDPDTIDCFFKQLLKGVSYLHSMGVAHRDLKPENLLLDGSARILKITDFGVSEVFRAPFESTSRKAQGMCGSGPYIAPEEFIQKEYDSEAVDVWAVGIIFYVMTYNSIPWKSASPQDSRYKHYQEHRGNFWPIDRLPPAKRKIMYRILDPEVSKRGSMKEIMADEWIQSISCCRSGMPAEAVNHSHRGLLEKPHT